MTSDTESSFTPDAIDRQMNASETFSWLTGSEMGGRIRAFDWRRTPLGPIEHWPAALVSTLGVCLTAQYPMAIYWGSEGWLLYNDAWRPILGDKHPWALGRAAHEVWPELWDTISPLLHSVQTTGQAVRRGDELLPMQRFGYTEECYFDYSFNPIRSQSGEVEGILNIVQETTYRVLNDRRMRLLRELASRSGFAHSQEDACYLAIEALATDQADVPFALLYHIDRDRRHAHLIASTGLPPDSPARQQTVSLTPEQPDTGWPLSALLQEGVPVIVDDVGDRFGPLSSGYWPEPARQALLLPLSTVRWDGRAVMLVAGISPRRPLDDDYRSFFTMVESHIAGALTNAEAYSSEKRRVEALTELDRAKTAFFSNVSHEFRTPLTLMLGPLEEELRERPQAPRLEVAHRNSLRLLKLVNTLLEFSRLEAGRVEARYEPTDLAAYSAELASQFRSAVEQAGLVFRIDCPPLPELIYVDRDMWEKIVLNLLSNAFKFTFQGHIALSLQAQTGGVELHVQDTGVGIPPESLPRLFERFYRVQDMRSRTYEGSGIGLALVQELVHLHGGTVRVTSQVDQGSTFVVTLPFGNAHLPPHTVVAHGLPATPKTGVRPYLEEALHWLPEPERERKPADGRSDLAEASLSTTSAETARPRVLVVDDNADMRQYITRLLADRYHVTAVPEGMSALMEARRQPPDLILSDIMMPKLDGFGLLEALRDDPALKTIPVILLSARAGEESRIEGLGRGTDDYLVKPFGGRLLGKFMMYFDRPHVMNEQEMGLAQTIARTLAVGIERARAGELLRSNEERLRLAMAAGSMGAWDVDLSTGETDWDAKQYELFDRPRDKPLTHAEHFYESVHPDDMSRVREAAAQAELTGSFSQEFRVIAQDGSIRWLSGHGTAVKNDQGQVVRMVGINYDITRRKHVEETLQRSASDLEQRVVERTLELSRSREQLRALATELNLAGQRERQHLATELHDYLAQLLALSRIRLAKAKQQPMTTALGKILSELQDVMDQALTYTRTLVAQLSPPILKEFGLPMALKWLAEQMIQRDLQVSLELGTEHLALPEDQAMLLFQSIRELLMNIVKHASAKQARITVREEEGWLHITVSDQGRGFSLPDSVPAAGSTGIPGFGLFSIRERMLALGGRFELRSRPGQGTEATLTAPLAPGNARAKQPPGVDGTVPKTVPLNTKQEAAEPVSPTGEREPVDRPIHVLIADDHAMVRQGLCGLLAAYGNIHVVGEAADGEEAVTLTIQLQPDVVLMDVNMPQMDGIEATRRIKQVLPATIIIGLSVQNAAHVGRVMREAGAAAFLNKEAAVEDLYQTIQVARRELLQVP